MDLRFVTSTEEICRRVDAFAGSGAPAGGSFPALFKRALCTAARISTANRRRCPPRRSGRICLRRTRVAYWPLDAGRWPVEFCDGLDGSPVFEAGEKWLADLFTFLAFARQRGLRLRQDGEIYKKDQEALVELMSAKWQFDADPFLELHLWHLIEYALSVGIAAETGRRRVRPTELAGRWGRACRWSVFIVPSPIILPVRLLAIPKGRV